MSNAKTTPAVPGADVLARTLPAVTSTSDMPNVAETTTIEAPPISASVDTIVKPEPKVVETPKVEADKTEPVVDKTEPPKKDGIQKRMSELTADKKDAIAKAEVAETARVESEARADALDKQLRDVLTRVDKVLPKPEEAMRPKRADFDDPDKYDLALESYAKDQGATLAKAEAEAAFAKQKDEDAKKSEFERIRSENERVSKEYVERATKFKETAPDYDEVVLGKDDDGNEKPFTDAIASFVASDPDGPKVAYHLGKNLAELKRIASLPVARQFVEIGKIQAALNVPPKTTETPDPITPITTSRTQAREKTAETESTEEYVARRTQELRAERARR